MTSILGWKLEMNPKFSLVQVRGSYSNSHCVTAGFAQVPSGIAVTYTIEMIILERNKFSLIIEHTLVY